MGWACVHCTKKEPEDTNTPKDPTRKLFRPVIPAKAGIQSVKLIFKHRFYRLDTGVRRYDESKENEVQLSF